MEAFQDNLAVGLGLTAAATFLLGLFVSLNKRKESLGLIFFFYCISISWWSLLELLLITNTNKESALLIGRSMEAGVPYIPTLLVHFVTILLENPLARWKLVILYSVSIFLSMLFFTNLMISDVIQRTDINFMIVPGPFYSLLLIFFAFCISYGHLKLFQAYISSKGSKRVQMGYYLWSSIAGYLGGSSNFLLVYDVRIPFLNSYGTYAVPLYVGATTYAIVRYQLMDIRTVIHKTAMWLTTSSLALMPILFTTIWARPWITNLSDFQLSTMIALHFLLLVFYIKTVQPRIDHLFQRRKYDMQKILQGMVKELTLLKDLKGLTEKIVSTIREALYVSHSSIVLWDVKKSQYAYVGNESTQIDFRAHAPFLNWMQKEDRVIESMELEADPRHENVKASAHRYFEAFSAKVALPLIHDQKLIGIINLGEKDNLKPFTRSDIEFLSNLRIEASIALSNSLLYDDVHKMSETLRQWALDLERKVEERTRELSESKAELERSYQKLQELDQVKTQFFANISHELRTPLTLILAPLESMLHRETLQNDRREDLNSMYQNGLHLLKLINNLLDLAKIDAGKMQLSYSKADFTKFIKGIIASITPLAEKKEISLSFTCPDPIDEFYFDRDKIEKVLLNLIFNAIKFTPVGGKVEVSCEQSVDQVFVKVTDTGIGIAAENLHKLFNRFSQVDASSSRRFEGTGIGLALSKELIELHKGEISAESKLGSGTTMTFTIPFLDAPVFISEEKEEGSQD
ncbi:MAG: GAF domain-containing protein, partial [Nitrospirae bacterium]|nr:GAF domain-containing protein [Nitrospirota bacterium]